MKIYNVLSEIHHHSEVMSEIRSFTKRECAVKCLENALEDEIRDGSYTDEEIKKKISRDGDDFFCFYFDDYQSLWKYRVTIYETELV